jgi:hypothetical protein
VFYPFLSLFIRDPAVPFGRFSKLFFKAVFLSRFPLPRPPRRYRASTSKNNVEVADENG